MKIDTPESIFLNHPSRRLSIDVAQSVDNQLVFAQPIICVHKVNNPMGKSRPGLGLKTINAESERRITTALIDCTVKRVIGQQDS